MPTLLALITSLTFFIIFPGCTSVESHWEATKKKDSVIAYQNFLEEFPDTKYAKNARSRVEDLEWEKASSENTITSLLQFATKYSLSEHYLELEAKLEILEWQAALQKDDIETYTAFEYRYPNTKYLPELKAKLEILEWQVALQEDELETYTAFEYRYPNTKYLPELKAKLEILEWQAALQEDELETYTAFEYRYPNTKYLPELKAKLEILEWQAALKKDESETYAAYRNRYPDTKYLPELKDKLEAATWSEIIKNGNRNDFKNFLASYPDTKYKTQVLSKLEQATKDVDARIREGINFDQTGDSFREKAKQLNQNGLDIKDVIKEELSSYLLAIEAFSNAITIDPTNAQAFRLRAFARTKYDRDGNLSLMTSSSGVTKHVAQFDSVAITDIDTAIRLAPLDPKGYFIRGEIYNIHHFIQWNFFIEIPQNDPFINMMKPDESLAKKAIADLEKALKLQPNLCRAYESIGELYFRTSQYPLAAEFLSKAHECGIPQDLEVIEKLEAFG
ncbi:hypothetical protein [Nitrospira sp. Ecomares 2.1]